MISWLLRIRLITVNYSNLYVIDQDGLVFRHFEIRKTVEIQRSLLEVIN